MNILITGGASGLGKAITIKFAKSEENTVYCTYSSSIKNAMELQKEYKNIIIIQCDFKNTSSIENLTEEMSNWDLDVLVNNAYGGEFITSHFQKIDHIVFSDDFNNNVVPTLIITQKAISIFRKKRFGRIVTVLSAALTGNPVVGSSSYIGCKAYLEKLTKVWATENAKFNITSNSVSPSFMETNMNSDFDDRLVEQMEKGHPLKKLLTVEEVTDSIQFLTSSNSHLNGLDILLNAAQNLK